MSVSQLFGSGDYIVIRRLLCKSSSKMSIKLRDIDGNTKFGISTNFRMAVFTHNRKCDLPELGLPQATTFHNALIPTNHISPLNAMSLIHQNRHIIYMQDKKHIVFPELNAYFK